MRLAAPLALLALAGCGKGYDFQSRLQQAIINGGAAQAYLQPAPQASGRFYRGERIDGMNKLCFYNTLNGTEVITIQSVQLCPLN